MVKQAVIIRYEEKPIAVLPVITFQSAEDYVRFERECKLNYEELLSKLSELKNRLSDCETEICNLKLRGQFDRGEITEEEYESGVR